jgi:hypothetical protein
MMDPIFSMTARVNQGYSPLPDHSSNCLTASFARMIGKGSGEYTVLIPFKFSPGKERILWCDKL